MNATETVVTSFPQRWDIRKGQPRENNVLDTRNVLDSILARLKEKKRRPIVSVFDLAEVIMARCLGLHADKMEWEHERYRYLEIFDYSINYVANEEIRCFNAFADKARKKGMDRLEASERKTKQETSDTTSKPVRRQRREDVKQYTKQPVKMTTEQDNPAKASGLLAGTNQQDEYQTAHSNTPKIQDDEHFMSSRGSGNHPKEGPSMETIEERKKKMVQSKSQQVTKQMIEFFDELSQLRSSKPPEKEAHLEAESFDISHEVELLREIKDIRDELNILGNLFGQQRLVLEPFVRAIKYGREMSTRKQESDTSDSGSKPSLVAAVDRHITYIDGMDTNARRVYRHVRLHSDIIKSLADCFLQLENLLDLKQKQANVFEAHTARVSGNTITVFTVVTMIFLPASFMAAFLALPILQYPSVNDDKMELSFATKHTGMKYLPNVT
ncbi:hypothetical protein N0V92_005146 [Colletotrichum tropicale]|nr:hypothetical protein N0V92_005146 [Colletotrichum tropicale]